ncbi:MlaD family protein [Antrihabitans sp. YC2-6]|uniref:MlaD family protein n=1 Tax=Antrihabitans sp. YC2-6 TaxID=2799498 RepID=UPI0018F62B95|nr:MCE family protein [Antrihabitans sp. YC2-6]MBJ8346487.1 MCE family protein [Antrihabitans sp. YC2-6]
MIIDPSGRGPTMRQLVIAGIVFFVVVALLLGLLLLRYTGYFKDTVDIDAIMHSTGDGLDPNADVKFRGVLVGSVDGVNIAAKGEEQRVKILLNPDYASDIPANVTARVVPSNVFAVTSIELIDPSDPASEKLSAGDEIKEDTSKESIALQTTLTTLRTILDEIDPARLGKVLTTLSQGLDPSYRVAGSSIERLDRLITAIDTGTPTGEDLLSNMSAGIGALNESAPELLNVLGEAVTTAQTLTNKQAQFEAVLFGGGLTVDSLNSLFARNPDVGKSLVGNGATIFGALGSDSGAIAGSIPNLAKALTGVNSVIKPGPGRPRDYIELTIQASFTPFKPYTQADCPRYGSMVGPNCATAPAVADPGFLPPQLWPRRLDSAGPAPVIAFPPLPGVPSMPQIPGLQLPPGIEIPGVTTPASTQVPGVIPAASYVGPAAVTAVVGEKPDFMQMLLLGSALRGTALQVNSTSGGGER